MFDHFLTSLLQVVIVVDLIGAAAYAVLGALRQKQRRKNLSPPQFELISVRKPFWRWIRRPFRTVSATETDFERLRQILSSFQEGLI